MINSREYKNRNSQKYKERVRISFNIPKDFYKMYKTASQVSGKSMKTIFIESFKYWSDENGYTEK